MRNIFTEHPHSIGETYFQHLKFASLFGAKMMLGGLACIIHAILPCFFKKTGSTILLSMTHDFVERMPHIEGQVASLSQAIAKKVTETHTPS